ncbi:vWA domain-containing protein [Hugenholtzia roseola]|uniref:vWA domain-containing protein n=1 Tax=Hugenholtzia roseola TaxID=1002 RepID=UPI0004249090|nr:vWA domain-containing protein [Hugenholtzia roseola]
MSNLPTTFQTGDLSQYLAAIQSQPLHHIKAEPYTQEICRGQPTAIIFLVDQSGSMSEKIRGKDQSKADFVAKAINQTLYELVSVCTKGYGIGHYIDVALIGYGGIDSKQAYSLWEGNLKGKTWVQSDQLSGNEIDREEIEVEDRVRGEIKMLKKTIPTWLRAKSQSQTPMGAALEYAHLLLSEWIQKHPHNYPPTVFNITDGAQTDCSNEALLEKAKNLKNLHTSDGNVLLFNLHIDTSQNESLLFPSERESLPQDRYAQLMYDIASDLPAIYNRQVADLNNQDIPTNRTFTALAYQADATAFMKMIDIGTRSQKAQVKNAQ